MKIVTAAEYEKMKIDFLHRHNDWTVTTSEMNEYGEYYKTYYCTDDSWWREQMRPVYLEKEITVRGCTVKVTVKLLETEAYSTEDAQSIYYYEAF